MWKYASNVFGDCCLQNFPSCASIGEMVMSEISVELRLKSAINYSIIVGYVEGYLSVRVSRRKMTYGSWSVVTSEFCNSRSGASASARTVSREMMSLKACNGRRENVYNKALLKKCGDRCGEGERHVRILCCAG
jgi:hypothetical protein